LGLGYALEIVKSVFDRHPPASYEEYIVRRFGWPTYRLVFEPLADKVWGDPATLHPEMARTRLPASSGFEVILKLLGLKKESAETNAETFYYPRKGFGDWPQALAEAIEAHGGKVLVGVDVQRVEMIGARVGAVEATQKGEKLRFDCDYLVSSVPLPLLGRLVLGKDDEEFNNAVQGLQFRHLILVYIFLNRPKLFEDQWIFFPQRNVVFSRLFEQKQMNPELGPAERTAIAADFTAAEGSELWQASDEELAKRVMQGLVDTGFVQPGEAHTSFVVRRKNFYPRYDLNYAKKMKLVSDRLREVPNLLTTGRIGMYNYNNSDHCADMGRFIAERLAGGNEPAQIWRDLEQRVADYKIVD
jgi:protoporphyrinogen oxidase